jgi:predicted proteasome-type protease
LVAAACAAFGVVFAAQSRASAGVDSVVLLELGAGSVFFSEVGSDGGAKDVTVPCSVAVSCRNSVVSLLKAPEKASNTTLMSWVMADGAALSACC